MRPAWAKKITGVGLFQNANFLAAPPCLERRCSLLFLFFLANEQHLQTSTHRHRAQTRACVLDEAACFGYVITIEAEPEPVVAVQGVGFILLTVITLTAGTAFIMWLGEQIDEFGIGNGISLLIMAGILLAFLMGAGMTMAFIIVINRQWTRAVFGQPHHPNQ